ncbi:hypothetical protein Taro_037123 [Colocasia esculenta]|uniref:Uncharacterized protein n=1 Tax=Colocasia esculenta TaxID=4460 RepID=A0A843VZK7_COLES|nr:hypothetical protein [Colocasia esculenta]
MRDFVLAGRLHLARVFARSHPPPKKRLREMASQGKNRGVMAFSGTGLEQAIAELKQVCRVPKEIHRLENTMYRIIAVLKDAEKKQISSEAVRFWLSDLKQVVFDAEDLIDELATDAAVQSMGSHTHNTPTITPHMMCQIREMNDRLDLLEPQIPMLGLQLSTAEDSCLVLSKRRQTGSLLPDAASVIGRDGEKEQIIEILLSSADPRLLKEVEEKAFLLVLDDVWDASYSMWEELFKPLHSGKKGSKVLVTSRNRAFVDKMEGRMETPILLGGLSDANIWDVFKKLEDQKLRETPDTTVRHVSVWVTEMDQIDMINKLCFYGKLRTLLFQTSFDLGYHDLDQLFLKLKMLRVLGLNECGIRELPGSFADLKHLRYLDLGGNDDLERLPESLGNLYNLQVLDLNHCRSLGVLPSTMSQLVNLKHLQPYDSGLLSTIDGVGKLTGLQELQVSGRQLRELGGMCMLRQLTITDLEEVGSKEEAIQARLHTMERLQVLHLEWSGRWSSSMNQDSRKPELEEEVLQALRPNKGIRELHIQGYGGSKSPDWMEVPTLLTSFSSLRRVSLKYCSNWQVPPCSFLGQLRRLEYLEIKRMPEWEGHWSCPVSWDCLVELTITGCPMLKELPLLPPALRRLRLAKVGISCLHSELDGCSRVEGGIETTSSPHSSPPTSAALSTLYISSCDNLTSISGLLQQQLPDLVQINIYNCKNLVESLPEKGFGHLVSLKRLKIANCPELTCLLPMQKEEDDASTQHLPCSLEQLEINLCGDAMGGWWWVGLQRLTSITQLFLRGCPTTIELLFDRLKRHPHPHLPATLRELWIEGYNRFDHGQQSATSSACSSQLSPPPKFTNYSMPCTDREVRRQAQIYVARGLPYSSCYD